MTLASPPLPPAAFYITGGTLPPDALSYVGRQADADLLAALRVGEYCYVLNSRQMGKSSLCVRTIGRLQQHGFRTCFLDLTKFGSKNLTADQWYVALLSEAGRRLGLHEEFVDYWKAHRDVGPMLRFFGALRDLALPASAQPLVVFVDEIDVTLNLPFSTDEFFTAIRQCYIERADNADLKRLVFCLLGTATPADLIQDTRTSPFNIGKRIEVKDFTPQEAAPLANGLNIGGYGEHPQALLLPPGAQRAARYVQLSTLTRILYWTGGHPYLTQRLCRNAAEANVHSTADIDEMCHDLFLSHAAKESDDNLAFVRNRLLKSEADLTALLNLYRKVWHGKRVADDETNPLCGILKLSGVCKVEMGWLRIRNRIYAQVFDPAWVEQHLPEAELRRQKQAFRRGLSLAATIAGVMLSVVTALAVWAIHNAHIAQSETDRANQKTREANRSAEYARDQADQADRNLYAANMNLIQRDWENNNIEHVRELMAATKARGHGTFEWGYWDRLCSHLDLFTLQYGVRVRAVAFSPDGKRVLTGNFDGTAQVWDAATGKELLTLTDPLTLKDPLLLQMRDEYVISSAAFSPDGKCVLTGNFDGTVTLWNTISGKVLLVLRRHAGPVTSIAFSPDGRRILTGSEDKTAKVWNAASGKELLTLRGHEDYISSVAFSPDGRRILTGSKDKTARLWNAMTGQKLLTLKGHGNAVSAVAFSPDGERVLTAGSWDKTAKVWNAASGKELLTLRGHEDYISSVAFSPDGRRILTGSEDKTAKVWDAATGEELLMLKGHSRGINAVVFSSDGKHILTGGADDTVKLWDGRMDKEKLTLKGHSYGVTSVAFSPDGRRVLTGSRDKTARLWDTVSGQELLTFKGHGDLIFSVAFSPDGKRVVTGSYDGTVTLWNAISGKVLLMLRGHEGRVTSVAFSPDGMRILAARDEGMTAKVWDAATGEELLTLKGHSRGISAVAFSPDGKRILTGSADDTVKLWNAVTGEELLTLSGHSQGILAVAFSPDGKRVMTGGVDKTAKLWDAVTGRMLLTFKGHADVISSVAFSPDGTRVLTGSEDKTAKLWDIDNGQELLTLNAFGSSVTAVAFSPDGKRILTGSIDRTAKVWFADGTRLPLAP